MEDSLSIVIVSCDSYKDITEQYFYFKEENWKDCPFECIVAMELESIDNINAKVIQCGSNTTWSYRAIQAINETKSDYILLSIEDLFISRPVSTMDFMEIISFMKKENILYYRIPVFKLKDRNVHMYPGTSNTEMIRSNLRYNVSIGTSIWHKSELLRILGDGKMSAWDLEEYFLKKSEKATNGYLSKYVSDSRLLLHSVHMIKSGKWIPSAVKKMEKLGYHIDYDTRGFISFSDRMKLNPVYSWCSRNFPTWIRTPIKKTFSLMGFKFASK